MSTKKSYQRSAPSQAKPVIKKRPLVGVLCLNESTSSNPDISKLYTARLANTIICDADLPVIDASAVKPEVLLKVLAGSAGERTLHVCHTDALYGTCTRGANCPDLHLRVNILNLDGTLQAYAREIYDSLDERGELGVPALKAAQWLELAKTPVLTPEAAAANLVEELRKKYEELGMRLKAAEGALATIRNA